MAVTGSLKIPDVSFPSILVISNQNYADEVKWVHVVTLIDESQSIAPTLMNLDRLALIRLAIDRPDVESAFASVDFSNLHRNYFVRRDRRFGCSQQEVIPI